MKTKIKRHSREVLSVLLAVCMLVSCMTVGLIATDAAKVTENDVIGARDDDDEPVGANYYLYYRTDNSKSLSGMTAVQMTASGSSYTATFTTSNSNFALAFGTSNSPTSSLVTSSWTVNMSGSISWAQVEDSSGVYFVCGWASSGTTVTVTYNGGSTVSLSTGSGGGGSCSTNKTYRVVGTANIAGSDWSNTATANNMTYSSTLGCYTKTYTNVGGSGETMDFRIIEGSTWSTTWGYNQANKVDQSNIVTTWSAKPNDNDNNIRMVTSQKANVEIRFDDSKSGTSMITVIVTPSSSTVTTAVSPASSGTATVNGGATASNIAYGNSVTLAASPAANYHFDKWTANTANISFTSSTSASTTATIRGSGTVTANFEPNSFNITKQNTNCTMTAPNTAQYTKTVSVSATAASGYAVDSIWYSTDGGTTKTTIANAASGSFTMPASNVTVGAVTHALAQNNIQYGVRTGQSAYGYVSVGEYYNSATTMKHTIDSNTDVLEGTQVNFDAIPAGGCKFNGWYNAASGGTSRSSTQNWTVTSPSGNYYADFNVFAKPETGKIKLLVRSATNAKQAYWYTGASGTQDITKTDANSMSYGGYTCYLVVKEYTGTSAGVIIRDSGSWTYQTVNLSGLTPGKTYFINWDGTGKQTGGTFAEASFTNTYPVKYYVTNPEKGAATVSSNMSANAGASITFYHSPADTTNNKTNRTTTSFTSNLTNSKTTATSTNMTMPSTYSSTPTFTATFVEKDYYKVEFSAGSGGTISATAGGTTIKSGTMVQEGKSVTITAAPSSGYSLSGWTASGSISGTSISLSRTFTIGANTTARAYFTTSKGTTNTATYFGWARASTDTNVYPGNWTNFSTTYIRDGHVWAYIDNVTAGYYYISAYDSEVTSSSSAQDKCEKQYYRTAKDKSGAVWCNTNFSTYVTNCGRSEWGSNDSPCWDGRCNYAHFQVTSAVKALIIDLGPDNGSGVAQTHIADQNHNFAENNYRIIPVFNTDIGKVSVYAKDASLRGNSSYDYLPGIANTVITTGTYVTGRVQHDEFETAVATKGQSITVTTTIDANHRSTYYVRGFSFNGTTPALIEPNTSTGVYSQTYTIPSDFDYDYLEITPIYSPITDNKVQFYIENYDKALEATGWGNTLAVYPYYQNASGGYAETKHNAFGGYPGQPVIYYGGRRFIEIPTTYTTLTVDGGTQEDCTIKGVTLSNDYFDIVHRDYCREVDDHLQTYDYDDFYKIYKETSDGQEVNHVSGDGRDKVADQITFAFKNRTKTNNFSDSGNTVSYSNTGNTVKAPYSSFTVAEKTSKFTNGWEPLLDYHDRPVDLFGKQLTTAEQAQEPLLVVSDDYAIHYVGRYATTWTVYRKDGSSYTKIAEIAPSALVVTSNARLTDTSIYPNATVQSGYPAQPNLSTFSDEYTALKAYAGMPVEITYEQAIRNTSNYEKYWSMTGGSSEVAKRNDGRWFYSYMNEAINANLRIEYADADNGEDTEWNVDTFRSGTNKGTVTGASVKFTNTDKSTGGTYELDGYVDTEDYNEDHPNNPILSNQNDYFNFEATAGSGYIFAGWWFERDGIVTNVNDDLTKLDGHSQMTSNATFVARYIKNPSGHLAINHTVAEGSIGNATTYVAVKAVNRSSGAETWLTGDGTEDGRFEVDSCDISNPTYTSYNSGYTFVVELKTVTDDFTNFDHFSAAADESADYFTTTNQNTSGNTTTNYFEVDSNDLFALDENSFPVQQFDTLTYYSHLASKTYNYNFNYTYPAYLSKYGTQGYRVTGTFTYDELVKNMTLTGSELAFKDNDTKIAFLNKVAPFEDNFMQTISWDTSVTPTFSSNTLSATIQAVTSGDKKINLTFKFNYYTNSNYQPVANPVYLDGAYLPPQVEVAQADRPDQMSTFTKNGSFVTAPTTLMKDEATYIFRYWKVSNVRGTGSKYNEAEYTRCYYNEFNLALFQDSIVETVYTLKADLNDRYNPNKQQKDDEEMGITINFMENSRNQYNDNQSGTGMTSSRSQMGDRMYTEFLLNFNSVAKDSSGNPIQLNTLAADTKKAGLIIEVVGQVDYVDGKYVTKSESQYQDAYGTTISEIGTKLSGKDETIDQQSRLEHYINGGAESNPIRGAKSEFDVTELDNKNRIQYFYSLANRSHTDLSVGTNRYNVYRAYAYVCDADHTNIQISNTPVYFTIYDMASIQNYAEASVTGGIQ